MLKYVGNALSEMCNLGVNLKRLANVPVIYCLIASHLRITSIISFAHDSSIWAWLKETSLPLQHQWDKHPLLLEKSTSIVATHTRASWYSLSAGISAGVLTSGLGSSPHGPPHSMLASVHTVFLHDGSGIQEQVSQIFWSLEADPEIVWHYFCHIPLVQ